MIVLQKVFILATSLSVLRNYFDDQNYFQICTSAKPFSMWIFINQSR